MDGVVARTETLNVPFHFTFSPEKGNLEVTKLSYFKPFAPHTHDLKHSFCVTKAFADRQYGY